MNIKKTVFCPVVIISIFLVIHFTFRIFEQSLYAKDSGDKQIVSNNQWDIYSDTWGLTDSLGRTMPDIKKTNSGKAVLMFYHIWHYAFTQSAVTLDSKAPRSVTNILSSNLDALTNAKVWGRSETYHYWGEPLWSFYDIRTDDYVIRKHAQLLTDAGVDAIVIDYSNFMGKSESDASYTKDALTHLLDVFLDIRAEGGDTPLVVILTTWDYNAAHDAMWLFYEDFYKNSKYENLWFKWEGKPLALAWDEIMEDELKNYFTFRRPYPFNTPVEEANTWPWLSAYPQKPAYTDTNSKEMVSVGVAGTNPYTGYDKVIGGGMSAIDQNGCFIASGRSSTSLDKYLTSNPLSSEYHSERGAAFQESFDKALEIDPSILFITGFNEWIAARFTVAPGWANIDEVPKFGIFFDQFCPEFSRDIEPTRDGNLGDNFYNQLCINVRRFKGSREFTEKTQSASINIDGNFADWNNILREYRDDVSDISLRDSKGIGNNHYVNKTGRNDFKLMKITYDKENVYFFAETVDDISSFTDKMWMNLLIHTSNEKPNWEGFNYILNRRNVKENITTLEKSTGGYQWEIVSEEIQYRVNGKQIEISIPRSALGLVNQKNLALKFKWHDTMQIEGDYFEFYLSGDSAPNERFNYQFSTAEDKNNPFEMWVIAAVFIITVVMDVKRSFKLCNNKT